MTEVERFNDNKNIIPFLIKKYFPFLSGDEDILQEAYLVLWKCCKTFDPDRGVKFSTYVSAALYNTISLYRTYNSNYSRYSLRQFNEVSNLVRQGVNPHEACKQVGMQEFLYRQMGIMPVSLDSCLNEDTDSFANVVPDDYDVCLDVENKQNVVYSLVLKYLDKQKPSNKFKFYRLYTEDIINDIDRSQKEYSEMFGVCQSIISRYIKAYKREIKAYLLREKI